MIFKEEENPTYPGIAGSYRIFTGEWKKDVPNGWRREELVDAFAVNNLWTGNVVCEGNLKEGLWDGDIQCIFAFYQPVIDKNYEFDCSFSATEGIPLMKTEGYEGYVFADDVAFPTSGGADFEQSAADYWVECIIYEEKTVGTIGNGDVHMDETILWIFGE